MKRTNIVIYMSFFIKKETIQQKIAICGNNMTTRITQAQLNLAIKDHTLWLNSNRKKGKRLDLSGKDLSGLDLSGRDLSWTNLYKANLIEANLSESNLSKANLSYADLSNANLPYANLSKADLLDSSIEEAYSLEGANIEGIYIEDEKLNLIKMLVDKRLSSLARKVYL
jgi:uncharacterized protein YjbI with pentapeptide repeats